MNGLSICLLIFAVFYSTKGQTTVPAEGFCDLPKDEGTGSEVQVYLYYDRTQDKCYPFRFSGEGGNGNRFTAEKYCMRNCSAKAEDVYPIDRTKACHLPKTPGDCFGNYLRYYYDSAHGKCKTFYWTGCVGNGNRFLDYQRCNSTCFAIQDTGSTEGDEEEESDTPVGIILGAVLGIIGAIILIVVIVLTLKNKPSPKKSQKKTKEDPSATGTETPLQNERIEMA